MKLGILMSPISKIKNLSDESTLRIVCEAQRRDWQIFYMEPSDLFAEKGDVFADIRSIEILSEDTYQYKLGESCVKALDFLDAILMRADPPFDMNYIYTTYLLELLEQQGVLVINKPQSLRDANEKLFILQFPDCIPETLVTSKIEHIRSFLEKHKEIIVKPLDGFAGKDVYYLNEKDINLVPILERSTVFQTMPVMVQRFLPEIKNGDKRIVMIDGLASYAGVRVPLEGEIRISRHFGREEHGEKLTDRDFWLCRKIGSVLKDKGLVFAGLDIIGNYVTEINVTSVGWLHNCDKDFVNIPSMLLDYIKSHLVV